MSHKCGAGCRRKQIPSTRSGCPSCGNRRILDAGGRVRTFTKHMLTGTHAGMTRKVVAHVLNNWLVKGIRTDDMGRESWNYLAYVPGLDKVVRVSVSMDDERIINAFPDTGATQAYRRNDRAYFERRYKSLDVSYVEGNL